jgi:hypothetical protein
MKSVADDLRRETWLVDVPASASDRVKLALALGDQDLDVFRVAQGLTRREALEKLRRLRQKGRTPCSFFRDEQ